MDKAIQNLNNHHSRKQLREAVFVWGQGTSTQETSFEFHKVGVIVKDHRASPKIRKIIEGREPKAKATFNTIKQTHIPTHLGHVRLTLSRLRQMEGVE